MHEELCKLSANCFQLEASKSGHFVWIDRPDVMVDAVKMVLSKIESSRDESEV